MFLNTFRATALLLVGFLAYFYFSTEKTVHRRKRAPINNDVFSTTDFATTQDVGSTTDVSSTIFFGSTVVASTMDYFSTVVASTMDYGSTSMVAPATYIEATATVGSTNVVSTATITSSAPVPTPSNPLVDQFISPGAGVQVARGSWVWSTMSSLVAILKSRANATLLLYTSLLQPNQREVDFWTAIALASVNIDLYTVQGDKSNPVFVTSLLANAAPTTTSSGAYTYNVSFPSTLPIGPTFVFKISGPTASDTSVLHHIPDSDCFQIIDTSVGDFLFPAQPYTQPTPSPLITGRIQTISFNLSTAIAPYLRIDLLSIDWPESYTITTDVPACAQTPCIVTTTWEVPASLWTSAHYYLRVSGGSSDPAPAVAFQVDVRFRGTGFYSSLFAVTAAPATEDSGVIFKTGSPWFVGTSASASFTFDLTRAVRPPSWTLELYSTELGAPISLGQTLSTSLQPNTTISIDTSGLSTGLYFLRAWGWPSGQTVVDTADPISGISNVIVVVREEAYQAGNLSVVIPTRNWGSDGIVQVGWNWTGAVAVNGWTVDLYRNSVPHKLFRPLTPTLLDSSTTNLAINTSTLLYFPQDQASTDYQLYIHGDVNINGVTSRIGGFSEYFAIGDITWAWSWNDGSSGSTTTTSGAGAKKTSGVTGGLEMSGAQEVGKGAGWFATIAAVAVVITVLAI
ncbi:hypothetical protein HKX48_000094 [Thoreauomyces humboldtii]|nr:hypothetical protein HKX48_000094 [Thoreauomyces humboldtii]